MALPVDPGETKSAVKTNLRALLPSIVQKVIAGLIFGFIVFILLVLFADLRQVSQSVYRFQWGLYPGVIALTLWNYIFRFVKWQYFLKLVSVEGLPVLTSARLFVAGFPLAVTPGKVGEALKGFWLRQLTGIPAARGVSAVLAERISDGLAMLVLSSLGILTYPRYWPAFAIVLGLLLGAIIVSQTRPLAVWLLNLGENTPFVQRFAHPLREFYEGSFALFRPKSTGLAIFLGVISWLAEGVGFYLILIGLGLTPGWNLMSLAVFILSFSTVIGAISALPGGLLATDASLVGMLVLLLNLNPQTATAATLLIRFATLWFAVAIGLVAWAFSKDLLGFQASETNLSKKED